MSDDIPHEGLRALVNEKYGGDMSVPGLDVDIERLKSGEPLAYVIGHIPFLGLSLSLASHPLIPRPETEWWAELLCKQIGNRPLRVLDICAGSGAMGLAVLKECENAHVSFGELVQEHADLIRENAARNALPASRMDVRTGDLFAPFGGDVFDIIATNPPYIPKHRTLPKSVHAYEPHEALYAGSDGLLIIRRILKEAPQYLAPNGEVWMECDSENIEEAKRLSMEFGAQRSEIRTDQYGRPRLLVAYY